MVECFDQSILLLTKLQYCHVIDNNTGVVRLVEGPYRGSLESNEAIYGKIEDKIIVREGQYANKGQLLLSLNTSITESSIQEVKTGLELANKLFEKQQELWDKNIGSEIDYLRAKNNMESLESRLETLHAQLDLAEIKAPFSGIIDEITVKKGELAVPGVQIIQLVNLRDLYVNADVSEAYISNVKEGEAVVLEFPSYPDISRDVPVYRTGNIIKSANRTFKVQLKIKNEDERLKPNLLAKIKINDYAEEKALLVPSIIIKQDMQGSYLYIVDPVNQTAQKKYVESGRSYRDETMIIKGLSEGDVVIVSGYNQVSNGSKVKILS